MAFPQLAATSTGNLTANTVTASLSIMGGVNANDLLIAIMVTDGNPNVTWDNSAAGSWNALFSVANSTAVSLRAFWKRADGTEDDKKLKPIIGSSEMYAYHISRWTGVKTTGTPLEYTSTVTLTVSGSVPALTVTTGSDDYVWIALTGYDGNNTVSTYPTSYVNTNNSRAANANGAGMGFASIETAGTNKGQQRYVLSGADDQILVHISLQPEPPGADQTVSLALVASGFTHYAPSLTSRLQISMPHKASGFTYYSPTIRQPSIEISAVPGSGYKYINITETPVTGDNTAKKYFTDLSTSQQLYYKAIGSLSYSISFSVNGRFVADARDIFVFRRHDQTSWSAETTGTYTVNSAQTLNLALVASGFTHYAHTLTLGDRTLDLALVASGLTHYAPSFTFGDVPINLGLVRSGFTHYAPTMQSQAVEVDVGLVASGFTHYAPSFTVADVTLNLALVASGFTHFAPTINPRYVINLGSLASGFTHYAPTITLDALPVNLGLVASGFTFYSPTLQSQAVEVDAGFVDSTFTIYTPAIQPDQLIQLGLKASGFTVYGIDFPSLTIPTVQLVAVTMDAVSLDVVELTEINYRI